MVLGTLLVGACLYHLGGLVATLRFRRRSAAKSAPSDSLPSVSLLKPGVRAGRDFVANLRSHATQAHPDFEILVGAGAEDQDARSAVNQLRSEFPNRSIDLIECPEPTPGCNGKVGVLERLASRARNPILVMSDADIRVPPRYLRTLCDELSAPKAGLVTCLYGAAPGANFLSRLQALRINTEFPTQVLFARWLQGVRFAMGSTLALHVESLKSIGGFSSLRGVIGDDYHLGSRIAARGLGVEVSAITVVTKLPRRESWKETWKRELRWSRTIRKQRPKGHAALPLTFGTLWSCIALVSMPERLWALAAAFLILRLLTGLIAARHVRAPNLARNFWLVPLGDLWTCLVWLSSYLGNSVTWAGRDLRIGRGGRILSTRVSPK